jgi:hypothetical protein
LLAFALAEDHLLSVMPNSSPTDQDGHGTEMAGLALYGDLTSVLESDGPVALQHCLESVKLYLANQPHDPELYGEVTAQVASRIEIAAPQRSQRAFCLTVTADGRDEGFPSSWSARVDAICAGLENNERTAPLRLLFAAAGNVPWEGRHDYPHYNHVQGMQDPAQSWNAVSVGAYTERAIIQTDGYDGWEPIAQPGQLSPASATSLIWVDKSWPLKPDFVMEGGNSAIDPATGRADNVDDLMLLTTRVSPDGSRLTVAGKPASAGSSAVLLSYDIDIPAFLGQPTAYLGFSSGTAGSYAQHDLQSWSFGAYVPEPSTLVMLAGGAVSAAMVLVRRRRKKGGRR